MSIHSIVCIKSVVRTAPDGVGRRTPENSDIMRAIRLVYATLGLWLGLIAVAESLI